MALLSLCGAKMTSPSGLRAIMQDVATTITDPLDREWLNLSIGNPAAIPEVIAMWRRLTADALASKFEAVSCQYGPSRGAEALLDAIVRYFDDRYRWGLLPDNVVVGPGSQMLCFVAAALYAGPSDAGLRRIVLPVVPDYTGYQGVCMHAGGIVGVPPRIETDGDRGFRYVVDLDALERVEDVGMFLLSTPSNPTGRAADPEELDAIVRIAEARGVPVVVDNAYGEPFPQVAATPSPPVWHPNVINLFTMSKAGMPGERIGFAVGAAEYTTAMTSFIANSALHAPQLSQIVLANALASGDLDHTVGSVITPYYASKRRTAEKLLAERLPEWVDWRLHTSDGGMFCWLWFDHDWFDDADFYRRMKARKVFVVPGRHFFVDPASVGPHGTHCIRISLSSDEAILAEGIDRMADELEELGRGAGR
ncbi:MAG TPA: valine--pyruvate transaminase [Acidimicrobiales bacterium]|jgi:valine--pyruvate aminotransferase